MTAPTTVAVNPLRAGWRKLRTMRTAIILLILLGAGASLGSFFPQRPIDARSVRAWVDRNPEWAPIAEFFGLFDVFGAWWFMGIYGLLLVSLVGCLVPRYRAWWRLVRGQPRAIVALPAQAHYQAGTVAVDPEDVLAVAERRLRARRFRVVRTGDVVAAEKGHRREGGSLVFHTAFLVLLVGMSIGKFFGYSGQVALIEGETFTDTHTEYDVITEGRFFNERHKGFEVSLDRFDVSWYPNAVPRRFEADLRVRDGARTRSETVYVNSPMTHRGVRLYLLSWGWAPHLTVTQAGRVLYDGPTPFLPRDGGWKGVIKLPGAEPVEQGFDMIFFTDPELTESGVPRDRSPHPNRPLVVIQQYKGDLGLNRPQSVYELDTTAMVAEDVGAVFKGGVANLPDDVQIRFGELKQFAILTVATNPGAPILLFAASLLLVGLMPALYSSRRRVWVRAAPYEGAARLEIAGHALQRKEAFAEEFTAIVTEMDRDLHDMMERQPKEPIGAGDG